MKSSTRLILVRHGETDWNAEGRYQGQADPPLNARGREQARRVAQKLRDKGVDVIYSSPLKRALETAKAIADETGAPLFIEPRLMEINQGVWEGKHVSDIQREYPEIFRQWEEDPWHTHIPGGETLQQVQERVYAAIDDIIERHQGQTVVLVTHRTPIAMAKIRYQNLAPQLVRKIELPNTYWEEIVIPHSNKEQG